MSPHEINVNWDDIHGQEPLPDGRYPVRIDVIEPKTSQNENEYWNITMTVLEGTFTGRKVFDRAMLQPDSLWKLKRIAQAAGVNLKGRTGINSEELKDKVLIVNLGHEEYEGELRQRVKGYSAVK